MLMCDMPIIFARGSKKAVLSQENHVMQHVFPMPNDSLVVICFSLRKVKAIIALPVICRLKAD